MLKKAIKLIKSQKGEAYVGEGTKMVIGVVLGAAILAGLVLVANKVIIPHTEQWFLRMFGVGNGYVGEMYNQSEYGGNITENVMFIFGASESSFYQKYKNDADYGGYIAENFTASLYSGNNREDVKEWCEERLSNSSATAKEKQFAQDWLTEYGGIEFSNVDKRYKACSKEVSYYVMQRDKGVLTDAQMTEAIVSCAERHGFDGDSVRDLLKTQSVA